MTKGLQIIKPVPITESMIVTCDVPETDAAAYASGTTYAIGDLCVHAHSIYKSATNSNIGNTPATSPEHWVRVSATNRHKCLDTSNSTQTVQASGMTYRITPGQVVTGLALLHVSAQSARIRMIDPSAGTVYDTTVSLGGVLKSSSWWAWFSNRRRTEGQVLKLDLPAYYGADIQVDISANAGADAKLGVLLVGFVDQWGLGVQYGARVGITDYSKKEIDEYGDIQFVERAYAKRASFDLVVSNTDLDELCEELASLRATPVLVIGSTLYTCTAIYGWIGEFEIAIPYPTFSDCSLDVKGLT